MAESKKACWFEEWFDSDYYHLLYKDRDFAEAETLIRNLVWYLNIPKEVRILDLACGKGRHSIFLNALGFNVTGVDLSENSIHQAKTNENDTLHFKVGDMREPQGDEDFDLVLNLFTSFGYFESEEENTKTLSAIHQALKPGGKLVLDFMNSSKVLRQMIPKAEVRKGDVLFEIEKSVENQIIRKKISFEDQGKSRYFEEKVMAITRSDFMRYFEKTGFEFVHLSGNYLLEEYSEPDSERMIFIVRKPD